MRVEEAVAVLGRLTYKPEWDLQVYAVPGAVVLRCGTTEADTLAWFERGCAKLVPIVLTHSVSENDLARMDELALLTWAFDVFARRELHAVEEWLRSNGRPLRAPHPGRGEPGILGNGTSTPT